jgi:hypothetical protein
MFFKNISTTMVQCNVLYSIIFISFGIISKVHKKKEFRFLQNGTKKYSLSRLLTIAWVGDT